MQPNPKSIKNFNETLSKMINKVVRFNLSGPLLMQLTEEKNGDIGIILTHKNYFSKFLETMKRALTNDDFDVPEEDYNTFIESQDTSVIFPTFMLSSHKIDFNTIEEKLCKNAFIIFPRALKNTLSKLNKEKRYLFDSVFTVNKENVNSNGNIEKYKEFQFVLGPNIPDLNSYFMDYTEDIERMLMVNILPLSKASIYYNELVYKLTKMFKEEKENLFAIMSNMTDLTNIDLEKKIKPYNYLHIKYVIGKNPASNIYIYKDFIKGSTKLNKLYFYNDREYDCDMINALLYLDYGNMYQYTYYRTINVELSELDNMYLEYHVF